MDTQDKTEEPTVLFAKLHKKALALGLTGEDLANLESIQLLRAPRKYKTYILYGFAILMGIVAFLAGSSLIGWPISGRQILYYWFEMLDLDMEREPCVLDGAELYTDLFRPPVDCSMCRDVIEVVRVSNVSPEEFEKVYAYTGRPVVITDATVNWTAIKVFNFDFFKSVYTDDSPVLVNQEQNCQFFPYKTSFHNLGEVFNMSDDRAHLKDGSDPWYIGWSNCDPVAANILRQHYGRPYFLPINSESSKTDWLFLGAPGYGAHMHVDNVGNPSWQAQITGEKMWTLEPPPECYHECLSRIQVTVKTGEVIVLDTDRWYHSTLVKGTELSICIGSEFD